MFASCTAPVRAEIPAAAVLAIAIRVVPRRAKWRAHAALVERALVARVTAALELGFSRRKNPPEPGRGWIAQAQPGGSRCDSSVAPPLLDYFLARSCRVRWKECSLC